MTKATGTNHLQLDIVPASKTRWHIKSALILSHFGLLSHRLGCCSGWGSQLVPGRLGTQKARNTTFHTAVSDKCRLSTMHGRSFTERLRIRVLV
eukprot:4561251-Amphidinium_carterae.1